MHAIALRFIGARGFPRIPGFVRSGMRYSRRAGITADINQGRDFMTCVPSAERAMQECRSA